MQVFEYDFKNIDNEGIRDLISLEKESAIIVEQWIDELGGFRWVKIPFTPVEIREYIRSLWAYELFLRSGQPALASQVAGIPTDIASRADKYVLHSLNGNVGPPYHCEAAFLGAELEELICSTPEERRFLLEGSDTLITRIASDTQQFRISHLDYLKYIKSDAWRQKADEVKKSAGYRCQVCNIHDSQIPLDAHHRTYERLGFELLEDITILCRNCHKLFHRAKKVA